jgi:hypothetical protein
MKREILPAMTCLGLIVGAADKRLGEGEKDFDFRGLKYSSIIAT